MNRPRHEYYYVIGMAVLIMAAASVPYLVGMAAAPESARFIGLTHNIDDASVYLSWMRQAADGRFFAQNLFTTEPQAGVGFNLLFLALGKIARYTQLPLMTVFHAARIVLGLSLLLAIYSFSAVWIKDLRTRKIGLLIVGTSAGLGWLFTEMEGIARPVDLWQPEAITFLSLYLSPLFSFSILLMVGGFYCLLRFTETGRWSYPVLAGVQFLILANVHTYDIVPVALAWAMFAVYRLIRHDSRAVVGGLIAGAIAFPAAAYQLYVYLNEPVFHARATVETLSPAVYWYLLGYGLLIPLAILGVRRSKSEGRNTALLVCWIAAAFIAAYLPVAFQRKMIMGAHIPLSILAAAGLVSLMERLPKWQTVIAVAAVLLMLPTNAVFLARDMDRVLANEAHTTAHAPMLTVGELAGLDYLRAHTTSDDIILATPDISVLIPGFSGARVYCGHWGETMDFGSKLRLVYRFFTDDDWEQERVKFLADEGITFVVGYHWNPADEIPFRDFRSDCPPYLEAAFSNEDLTVYRVVKR